MADTGWNYCVVGGWEDQYGWSTWAADKLYTDNNDYNSCSKTSGDQGRAQGYKFGLSIAEGKQIDGIAVRAYCNQLFGYATYDLRIACSWDGGSSWTSEKSIDGTGVTWTEEIVGGASDTWGRTWAPAEFVDNTFKIKMRVWTNGSGFLMLDSFWVKVYYSDPVVASVEAQGHNDVQMVNGAAYEY